jgi:hypothetical protein
MAPTISKRDTVTLPDGSVGETLEALDTDSMRVYRIKKGNNEIVYFDESKVTLKKKHLRNYLRELFQ